MGNICSQCGLSRKSFYYHFKDKYELINWIYYTEFVEKAMEKQFDSAAEPFLKICAAIFYENRDFYNKTIPGGRAESLFSEYSLFFDIFYYERSSGRFVCR